MREIFLELNMGASGDMLVSSLLDLLENKEEFIKKMNNLNLDDLKVKVFKRKKSSILGLAFDVHIDGKTEEQHFEEIKNSEENCHGHKHPHTHHDHQHTHTHHYDEHSHSHAHHNDEHTHSHTHHSHDHFHADLKYVNNKIDSLNVSSNVKKQAKAVYEIIAKAEGKSHGLDISKVHFHEVGSIDAIADIVGFCVLLELLKVNKITANSVNLGSSNVKCAHGILPVPAPATANILRGVPCYQSDIKSELCTPTGAALIKYFVDEFSDLPESKIIKIGYGTGKKEFKQANILRSFIIERIQKKN